MSAYDAELLREVNDLRIWKFATERIIKTIAAIPSYMMIRIVSKVQSEAAQCQACSARASAASQMKHEKDCYWNNSIRTLNRCQHGRQKHLCSFCSGNPFLPASPFETVLDVPNVPPFGEMFTCPNPECGKMIGTHFSPIVMHKGCCEIHRECPHCKHHVMDIQCVGCRQTGLVSMQSVFTRELHMHPGWVCILKDKRETFFCSMCESKKESTNGK